VVVSIVFALLYRTILSVAFDVDFARSQRLPVAFIEYLMMALIALTIVSTLRMVGIVLSISLLTIPQMSANVLTHNFKHMIAWSIAIGWVDCLMGLGLSYALNVPSGASIIFGNTGGVMEAALRSAYYFVTGENPPVEAFKNVRGLDGWKEETFDIKGTKVRVAVTSGLSNTRKLMKALERGEVSYDFVEVMACPGGCAGGGGQPIKDGTELAGERGEELYAYDERSTIRFSHENQSIQNLYKNFLDKPCSHLAHDILHTDHEAWDMPVSPRLGLKDYEVCELCR